MKYINIKEFSQSALNNKKQEENHITDISKKVEEVIEGCPTGWKCGAECTNRCIL